MVPFMNGPLNHWFTRFVQNVDSFRNEPSLCVAHRCTTVLLFELKQTKLCLKYNTLLTFYLLNCSYLLKINITFALWDKNSTCVILHSLLVWCCLTISYDINMRQKLIRGIFAPISWILGAYNCILEAPLFQLLAASSSLPINCMKCKINNVTNVLFFYS